MCDEAIEEIRAARKRISAECGHDVRRVIAYYREIERELRASGKYRFIDPPATPHSGSVPAPSDPGAERPRR